MLKTYIVSDEVKPVSGGLHVRIVDFTGKVVKEANQTVSVPPLSSQVYVQWPLSDLSGGDPAREVAVADLGVGGLKMSNNLIYLVPTKQVHLPDAHISTELTSAVQGFFLKLSSPELARNVYVTFGDASAEVSDNYFDLLPGEPVVVKVVSGETGNTLKAKLRVISLADAFQAADTSK